MPVIFFYLFAVLAAASACAMVIVKNPVSSALWMVASFVGLAALFIGLNAYFVGIIQILVYAGAIMVLFIFIIMLLDLKAEEKRVYKPANIAAAAIVPGVLLLQILGVLLKSDLPKYEALDLDKASFAHREKAIERYELEHGKLEREENGDYKFSEVAKVPQTKIQQNLAAGQLPDVHLIGQTVFAGRVDTALEETKAKLGKSEFEPIEGKLAPTSNNLPLQVMGVLLLVATTGVVVLSKKNALIPAPSNK